MCTNILLLDDENALFKSIKRLVRPLDATLLAVRSAECALELCTERKIQLVIVDINRRDLDVSQFLSEVSDCNPCTRKLVLTSYAELETTIDAINEGKINRYFTKPWDPDCLRMAIAEELDEYTQIEESLRRNEAMGQTVQSLKKKATFTARLYEGIPDILRSTNYHSAINIYSSLLEERRPGSGRHGKQVAKTAIRMCEKLAVSLIDREKIATAAELHQIGLLGLPDAIVSKSVSEYSRSEHELYEQYPRLGAKALGTDQSWKDVALIVRHHREDFMGSGFPDQMVAAFIPLGSRIVRICADYEKAKHSMAKLSALQILKYGAGTLYDPELVDILLKITKENSCNGAENQLSDYGRT